MSQENVDLIRRALVAFVAASYDPRSVKGFFELFRPQVEYDISRTNPETQLYLRTGWSRRRLGAVDRHLGGL